MKVFITGGSGFVGKATILALRTSHEVVAMARTETSADMLRNLGARPVVCSLGSVDSAHLLGCDVVIHSAAYIGPWGTREQFMETNVEGTGRLLNVAIMAGARRFVHLSTEAVLWYGQDLNDIDESYPYPRSTPFIYAETKAEAEKRVLAADSPETSFTTIALRPRTIWGPGDRVLLPTVMRMVHDGTFVWIDNGQTRSSVTHIENVVHAIKLAMEASSHGEAYFITDDETQIVKEFLTKYLATHGVAIPNRSLPAKPMLLAARLIEAAWRLLRIKTPPPVTRHAVALMACTCSLRIDKARRELGYEPVISVAEGMAKLTAGRLRG